MSTLRIFDEKGQALADSITDLNTIATQLDQADILFERWDTPADLPDDADQEAILEAYKESIQQLNDQYGFELVDVAILTPDNPNKTTIRQQFNFEHTHSDFEVRFFVEGSGIFYFHLDNKVYVLLCEKGDLINHWFDMGSNPDFKLIRFFPTEDGWVAEGSGDDIATRLPDMDTFMDRYVA